MKGTAEPRNHVYDIVGALHSVHDELGSGINEYCCQETFAMELHRRVSPCAKGKLLQIVVSKKRKTLR